MANGNMDKVRREYIAARIRKAREDLGLSQEELGKLYGCSVAFISQVERGVKGIGINTLERLANALGKPVEWFLLDKVNTRPYPIRTLVTEFERLVEHLDVMEIPIRGSIPAGYPFPEEEQIEGYISVSKEMLGTHQGENIYALRVSGDSLMGDGILSGDIAVIDPTSSLIDGKIYALRLGNEAVLRHLYRDGNKIRLEAANGNYQVMYVKDAEVLGRVVLSIRKF